MSQGSVMQEIAALRAQADELERRVNDPSHHFTEDSHRERLLAEVRRLRDAAQREEDSLGRRRQFH